MTASPRVCAQGAGCCGYVFFRAWLSMRRHAFHAKGNGPNVCAPSRKHGVRSVHGAADIAPSRTQDTVSQCPCGFRAVLQFVCSVRSQKRHCPKLQARARTDPLPHLRAGLMRLGGVGVGKSLQLSHCRPYRSQIFSCGNFGRGVWQKGYRLNRWPGIARVTENFGSSWSTRARGYSTPDCALVT